MLKSKDVPYLYDFQTTNESFLEMVSTLRKLGVKNNKFFMKLYNEELMEIDPFDCKLDKRQQSMIINEILINPWYFLREIVRIPEMGGGSIRFKLNLPALSAIWCALQGIDTYVVSPRQTRRTVSIVSFLNWVFISLTRTEVLLYNKKNVETVDLLNRAMEYQKLLPKFIQNDLFKLIKVSENSQTNNNNMNKFTCKPTVNNIEKAYDQGKGLTMPIQIYDNFEFIPFNTHLLQSSEPAYNTIKKQVEDANGLSFRILSSTVADGDKNVHARFAEELVESLPRWKTRYFDKSLKDLKNIIEDKPFNMFYIEYDFISCGHDHQWFKQQCLQLNEDKKVIRKELLLQRT